MNLWNNTFAEETQPGTWLELLAIPFNRENTFILDIIFLTESSTWLPLFNLCHITLNQMIHLAVKDGMDMGPGQWDPLVGLYATLSSRSEANKS